MQLFFRSESKLHERNYLGIFQQNYIAKARTVVSYNHALLGPTGSVVGAEYALFSDARMVVIEILRKTKKAFNDVSIGRTGDIVVAAKIGSAAVDAATGIAKEEPAWHWRGP